MVKVCIRELELALSSAPVGSSARIRAGSVMSARDALTARIRNLTEYVGGSLEVGGVYPAWEYKKDSVLREKAIAAYESLYATKPYRLMYGKW